MIFITSYNRPKMLLRLLKELKGEYVVVIDDGSEYNPIEHMNYCDYYRTEHQGRQGYWKNWQLMFDLASETEETEFIFIPDDVHTVDLVGLRAEYTKGTLNVLNVGKDRGWSPNGYVDCGFICHRKVLEALNWAMIPISPHRFINPFISSGVGQQLTNRLFYLGIPMYTIRNYAIHGDHESQMHPLERRRNPLIAV